MQRLTEKEKTMHNISIRHLSLPLTFIALLSASSAHASCGGAFCTINTSEDALGPWVKPGWRMDLRAEYVEQDTLRSGSAKIAPAGEPDTHDEVRTLNRNFLASLDYSWNAAWGVSAQVPWVSRFHEHIHNDPVDGPASEQWRFEKFGDVRIVGRYQFMGLPDHAHAAGVQFGLKLPTGSTTVNNSDGERAERTLQPGTGTTDLVLGTYYNTPRGRDKLSWFAQAMAVSPLNSHEDFRPGLHLTLSTGLNYVLNDSMNGLLQLNLSHKARDRGAQAEPDDSGSRQAFISPGLSIALNQHTRIYGFVQLPVYQSVNGAQLTADRAFVIGGGQVF
jgi:hypothetical protein